MTGKINPRYKNGNLRRKHRARFKSMDAPCGICGGRLGPIHYDEPSDAQHPLSFVFIQDYTVVNIHVKHLQREKVAKREIGCGRDEGSRSSYQPPSKAQPTDLTTGCARGQDPWTGASSHLAGANFLIQKNFYFFVSGEGEDGYCPNIYWVIYRYV